MNDLWENRRQRASFWAASDRIPVEFKEKIDRSRTSMDWKAFDEIQRWDGRKSILAQGPSQLGKSRAIYEVLRREYVDHGRHIVAMDEIKLLAKLNDAFRARDLGDRIDLWTNAEILFFDDIDKLNFTQGVTGQNMVAVVFGVIKARMAAHRPTVLSMNLRVSDAFSGVNPAIVASLVERMKQGDHWHVVTFRKPSRP